MPRGWSRHRRMGLGLMALLYGSLFVFILIAIIVVGSTQGPLDLEYVVPFGMIFVITLCVMLVFARYLMLITDLDAVSKRYDLPYGQVEFPVEDCMARLGCTYRRFTPREYRLHGSNVKWRREPPWMGAGTTGWSKYDVNEGDLHLYMRGMMYKRSEMVMLVIYYDSDLDSALVEDLTTSIDAALGFP